MEFSSLLCVPLGDGCELVSKGRKKLARDSRYLSPALVFLAMSMVAQFGVASLLWAPAFPLKKKKLQG